MEAIPTSQIAGYERLPSIDFAVRGDRKACLEELADIADAHLGYRSERHFDAFGQELSHVVNIRIGEGLNSSGGQLISHADRPGRIMIEMHSLTWTSGRPTRAEYIEFARKVFTPLLRVYNRAHGARARLRIVRPQSFALAPRTKSLFDQFVALANVRSLHPLDWKRFYRLVKEGRQEIPMEWMQALLIEKGFGHDQANSLAEIYMHLWTYKRLR